MGASAPRGGYPVCRAKAASAAVFHCIVLRRSGSAFNVRCWVWGLLALGLGGLQSSCPDWHATKGYSPALCGLPRL